jgi:hypothetical protein
MIILTWKNIEHRRERDQKWYQLTPKASLVSGFAQILLSDLTAVLCTFIVYATNPDSDAQLLTLAIVICLIGVSTR